MIKRVTVFILMILTGSAVANLQGLRAESFQFEAGGSFHNQIWNSFEGEKRTASIYGINATAFSEQVSIDGRPYMEAAFLQKACYVTVNGAYGKYIDNEDEVEVNNDRVFAGISAAYVFSFLPVFVKAGYEYTSIDGEYREWDGADLVLDYDGKIKSYYGNLGYYLTDGFTLAGTAGIKTGEVSNDYYYHMAVKDEVKWFGGYLKYVTMLNADLAINIEGSYNHVVSREMWQDDDKVNHVFMISCDFYVNPKVGIGGSVEFDRGADDEMAGNKYSTEISVFVTHGISVTAGFGFFSSDAGSSENNRSADLMMNIRF